MLRGVMNRFGSFPKGRFDYLIMVDHSARFPFMVHLWDLTTAVILRTNDSWFLDFGYPITIRSDGRPQF